MVIMEMVRLERERLRRGHGMAVAEESNRRARRWCAGRTTRPVDLPTAVHGGQTRCSDGVAGGRRRTVGAQSGERWNGEGWMLMSVGRQLFTTEQRRRRPWRRDGFLGATRRERGATDRALLGA